LPSLVQKKNKGLFRLPKKNLNFLVFGQPRPELKISNTVAAIIRTPDRKFLLQLREEHPQIWYPGYWGCFGGALDPGERSLEVLKRELQEELELSINSAKKIMRLQFDLKPSGLDSFFRDYFFN
jgi:8-oxo-dGTP pyrophosphatase MutT (NUDIX family)